MCSCAAHIKVNHTNPINNLINSNITANVNKHSDVILPFDLPLHLALVNQLTY